MADLYPSALLETETLKIANATRSDFTAHLHRPGVVALEEASEEAHERAEPLVPVHGM